MSDNEHLIRCRSSDQCSHDGTAVPESAVLLPNPQGHRAPHSLQDDVVLRVALWVLMGGAAAESILAAELRPAA